MKHVKTTLNLEDTLGEVSISIEIDKDEMNLKLTITRNDRIESIVTLDKDDAVCLEKSLQSLRDAIQEIELDRD